MKGEPSIGLTGAESAKGLPETGVAGEAIVSPIMDPYGGGAVAVEDGRGMGSPVVAVTTGATARAEVGPDICACDTASRYGGATSSMLCRLGSTLFAPARELLPALRTLASRLRMLLVLENRPPMSSSASKENARRWRDHFLLAFLGFFSDTAAPPALALLRRLLAQKKNNRIPTMAATTTGTATAALRAEEQEMLSQDFSVLVNEVPDVLLAALLAVLEAPPVQVELAAPAAPLDVTEVAKVVGEVAVCEVELAVGIAVALAPDAVESVWLCELVVVCTPAVVSVKALWREDARLFRLFRAAVPGAFVPVGCVKGSPMVVVELEEVAAAEAAAAAPGGKEGGCDGSGKVGECCKLLRPTTRDLEPK